MNKKNTMIINKLIKKFNNLKNSKKTWLKPIKFNMLNLRLGSDTEVTLSKANKIKIWSLIIKQSNVEGWK